MTQALLFIGWLASRLGWTAVESLAPSEAGGLLFSMRRADGQEIAVRVRPRFMRGLDCFVLPSVAEGVSNTILEAMATRLPVIATRVGGNAELIESGMTGTLVPPGQPDALARIQMNPSPASRAGCMVSKPDLRKPTRRHRLLPPEGD